MTNRNLPNITVMLRNGATDLWHTGRDRRYSHSMVPGGFEVMS